MPKRKDIRTIRKIMDLRAEGLPIRTIARKLKIHPNTSRQYCYIADKIMSLEPQKIQEALLANV